jgi:Family of unknown function (DUF5760)
MNEKLVMMLKKFHKIQQELDKINEEYNKAKAEIERTIIDLNMIGKKFVVGSRILCYKKTNSAGPLTQSHVAKCLEDYFGDDEREAEALLTFILENRQRKSKYLLEIKRK